MFANGQEVVNHFGKILKNLTFVSTQAVIQPVSLLILDINMPILNGFETKKAIEELFVKFNARLNSEHPEITVLRPLVCYLSQFDQKSFYTNFGATSKAECYIEKPLPFKELVSLLRLLNLH